MVVIDDKTELPIHPAIGRQRVEVRAQARWGAELAAEALIGRQAELEDLVAIACYGVRGIKDIVAIHIDRCVLPGVDANLGTTVDSELRDEIAPRHAVAVAIELIARRIQDGVEDGECVVVVGQRRGKGQQDLGRGNLADEQRLGIDHLHRLNRDDAILIADQLEMIRVLIHQRIKRQINIGLARIARQQKARK